jgi:hypothetical protein
VAEMKAEEGNLLEVWWTKESWSLSTLSEGVSEPWPSATCTVSE